VVGGSALYIHAILDEMSFPPTDPAVRARWQAELDRIGPAALHEVLRQRDPRAAAGILPGNGRRIVRALEVVELTGSFTSVLPHPTYAVPGVHQFGMAVSREVLDARIEVRVETMWQRGFVDEVRSLTRQGLRQAPTASRALGYQQVLGFLDGSMSEDVAKRATIVATRRFARKQLSWFKRDARITWLDPDEPATVDAIASCAIDWRDPARRNGHEVQ
jgi:tRNA dimethylallyltransferase